MRQARSSATACRHQGHSHVPRVSSHSSQGLKGFHPQARSLIQQPPKQRRYSTCLQCLGWDEVMQAMAQCQPDLVGVHHSPQHGRQHVGEHAPEVDAVRHLQRALRCDLVEGQDGHAAKDQFSAYLLVWRSRAHHADILGSKHSSWQHHSEQGLQDGTLPKGTCQAEQGSSSVGESTASTSQNIEALGGAPWRPGRRRWCRPRPRWSCRACTASPAAAGSTELQLRSPRRQPGSPLRIWDGSYVPDVGR